MIKKSKTQAQRWEESLKRFSEENDTLEKCVQSFLEILDYTEESDSGRNFHPTTIGSCRVWEGAKLKMLFKKFRELS